MLEGTQIGGYRVLQRIGRGGMGSVWLAEHIALGRRAALKLLHPELSSRPEFVTRFFNEARAATAIADPGIVQIFDFGQHVDGRGYIVMELLDGEPLDGRLKRSGALTIPDGLRLMRQVAGTLGAAHACGIVHRDLKPENIYIVRDPEVPGGERAKVLDFGIAKLVGDPAGNHTDSAMVMGTPAFMSPEQCRGAGQVDQRSDVYALGCVLFTLITGRPPFTAKGAGEIITMHLLDPAPAPSELHPGIPPEIDQLVLRCLAKDPAHRFPTASELATAIGELLGSSAHVPIGRPLVSSLTPAPTTLTAATGTGGPTPTNRSRVGWIAAMVGLPAIGVVIAMVTTSRERQPAATPAQPPMQPQATAAAPPSSPALPAPPDPRAEVAPIMKTALARFVAWSRDHPGAPCPDADALGAPDDPWGHPPMITCTEQPGDQIAGAISAGRDGQLGTADDIVSWQLGRDITDLVHGGRWTVAPRKPATPRPSALAPARPTHVPKRPGRALQFDDNGLPITR